MKRTVLLFCLCAAVIQTAPAQTAAPTARSQDKSAPSGDAALEAKLVGQWTGSRRTKRGTARTTIDLRADHTFTGSLSAQTMIGAVNSTFEGRWALRENGKILVREYTKFDGPARQMEGREETLTILRLTDGELSYRNPKGVEVTEHRATQK